jgi:lipopolysaccharide/colanic/teichoic acid biosynthesis glycosyltransferase
MSSWYEASLGMRGRNAQLRAKRAIDIVGALTGLLVLAPFLIVVALIVAMDSPGPVIFRQERQGRDGRLFQIIKFRSLRQEHCDASGLQQITLADRRLTRIGRFLRRTSIDELPQLANVLAGDMSLVGPRPHVPGMLVAGRPYTDLVPHYEVRLSMAPGITGWAQVNGQRGPVDGVRSARARVAHDLAYIEDFSIALDLRILWMTVRNAFVAGGK